MGKTAIQIIGADIGRGFSKGYTEFNGLTKECVFKSIIGEGKNMDNVHQYENPIYITVNKEEEYFVGLLAEKESFTPIRNSKDSKVTDTVEILLYAVLNELVISDNVKIMLGVPYKMFRKTVLEDVVKKYKGKKVSIKDNIQGGTKTITINDISIFRESDAALMWEVKDQAENNKPLGMINVGFRTTEIAYYDKALKFNDKRSNTLEYGNRTALSYVKDILEKDNIVKEVFEIDTNNDDYEDLKKKGYKNLSEKIDQEIEDVWINKDEMDIYISGGTALRMKFDDNFKLVKDPQMATSKGLWLLGTEIF